MLLRDQKGRFMKSPQLIDNDQHDDYHQNGFVLVPGLFSTAEVAQYRDHYMSMNANKTYPGAKAKQDTGDSQVTQDHDPLKVYPRLLQMHRWDRLSLEWMIDDRLRQCLTALLGREPYAVQTMIYYKPPGARGQAIHQDQYYLRVQPGTCMAAWMALDRCDEENGCLQVVPGSHTLPILCTVEADTGQSFTDVTVPLPENMKSVPVVMEAGDVLFFNGQLIHGSYPNTSQNRFRRALIGHYIAGEAEKVAKYYHPVLRLDGSEITLDISEGGSQCGVWVEKDGQPVVEMQPV